MRGQKWGFPLTLTVALTTGQHYRAACDQCKKTSQFKAHCKGDISRAFKTAKITVFDTKMCKRPDVPLQAELLALTIQLRTSQPSILEVLHGWEY